MYNILIWGMRISQNLDFFRGRLPVANFLLASFLSFFSALSISLPFHVLSGCRKKLGVHYGQNLINYRYNGPFYRHFCTKTGSVVFNLLRQNAVDIQNRLLCG